MITFSFITSGMSQQRFDRLTWHLEMLPNWTDLNKVRTCGLWADCSLQQQAVNDSKVCSCWFNKENMMVLVQHVLVLVWSQHDSELLCELCVESQTDSQSCSCSSMQVQPAGSCLLYSYVVSAMLKTLRLCPPDGHWSFSCCKSKQICGGQTRAQGLKVCFGNSRWLQTQTCCSYSRAAEHDGSRATLSVTSGWLETDKDV